MKKRFAAIALLVALAIPVGAQNLDFLSSLMKAVVEEFGIQRVIAALEDLGYIGEDDLAVSESSTQSTSDRVEEFTVRSPIWDDPEGEETLAYMVVSDDASCYSYIGYGRNTSFSVADRMYWRQNFIQKCVAQ